MVVAQLLTYESMPSVQQSWNWGDYAKWNNSEVKIIDFIIYEVYINKWKNIKIIL